MILEFLTYVSIVIVAIIVLVILTAILLFTLETARNKPILFIIIMAILIGSMLYIANPLNL